jgi:hypothetical protein
MLSATNLYDNEKDDVYGYFYIFEKDKIEKKEYLYEYVLLDKNLNKVSSGEFTEALGDGGKMLDVTCYYRKGFVVIQILEKVIQQDKYGARSRCRLLDVKENKLSDYFTLSPTLQKEYKTPSLSYNESIAFSCYPNSFGYTLDGPLINNKEKEISKYLAYDNGAKTVYNTLMKIQSKISEFHFLNEKLDNLWTYKFDNANADKKGFVWVSNANADNQYNDNVLVMEKALKGKKNESEIKKGNVASSSYLFFDKNTGKLLNEITSLGAVSASETPIKDVSNKKLFVNSKNEIVTFLNLTTNSKKNTLDENLIQGFSRVEYSITSGKELTRHNFTWDQLSGHLNIDEYGYVKDKDDPNSYLYLHDALMKSNGNLLLIFEQYKTLSGSSFSNAGAKINDLVFLELDKNMKLVQFKRIEKERKSVRNNLKMDGSAVELFGYFDYTTYQNMENDNYRFFYYNKQRPEGGGKKQWVLGIVTYENGQFSEQKLPLKSEDGSELAIIPAKKGYVLIYETFKDKDKSPEIRLEKIN